MLQADILRSRSGKGGATRGHGVTLRGHLDQTAFNPQDYVRPGITEDEVLAIKESWDMLCKDDHHEIDVADVLDSILSLDPDDGGIEGEPLVMALRSCEKANETATFSDFIDAFAPLLSDDFSQESTRRAWNEIDIGRTGRIRCEELARVSRELDLKLSPVEVVDMIRRADSNRDGEVTFEDFRSVLESGKAHSAIFQAVPETTQS
eukprot:gnl/TRDRNA2_/TRDRNA2_188619_c0_seq1.p1 gnl/TRDRNA2_/TRDRNA2_188619_c0~~gnl/TRDRNA2_/TRDRNA2_188619_c0_seq1.p1  ORF type:complete len:206 (+),score=31.83 gnl/TRDRNA2_/TRDRNA2_188619_c0_seq1:47-664(+)